MYQKPTAPLSVSGVLDDGFRLFQASFTSVFPLALAGAIAGAVPEMFLDDAAGETAAMFTREFYISMFVVMLVSTWLFAAAILRVRGVADAVPVPISAALAAGVACLVPVLVASIAYGLLLLFGLALFLVPGLILSLSLAFAPYLVVLERVGPIESLRQSHRLVWGFWWRTSVIFAVVLFVALAAFLLLALISGVSGIAGVGEGASTFSLSGNIVAPLVSACVTTLFYAFAYSVYCDLKLRKEGGDLDARLDAIDA
jgi:hypothetical protein